MATAKKTVAPAIMTKEAALALCDTIAKKGKALDLEIQKAAVTAIGYANIHGDVTIAQKLVESFTQTFKGGRLDALVAFFEALGNMRWDKSAKNVRFASNEERKEAGLDPAEKDVVKLMHLCGEAKWHEYGPVSTPRSEYDAVEEFRKLAKRLQKKMAEGKTVAHKETLEKVLAVLAG